MNAPTDSSQLYDPAHPPTPEGLHAEAAAYERFRAAITRARELFASNDFAKAQQVCEHLKALAEDLHKHAASRTAQDRLNTPHQHADVSTRYDDEWLQAYSALYRAQLRAYTELSATINTIADLRAHTQNMLTVLRGNQAATYDSRGRRLPQ